MKTVKEYLMEKYSRYVANLTWHIDTNKPNGKELEVVKQRIADFNEILDDIKTFLR